MIRPVIWLAGVVALTVGMLTAWLTAVLAMLTYEPGLGAVSGGLFAITGASALVAGIGVALLRAGLPWRGARTLELGNPYAWTNFTYRPFDVAGVLALAAALPAIVFVACETMFPTPAERGRHSMWFAAGFSAWVIGTVGVAGFLWYRWRAARRRRLDAARAVAERTGGRCEEDVTPHLAIGTPLTSFGSDYAPRPKTWLLPPSIWRPDRVSGSCPCAVTWDHDGLLVTVFDYVRLVQRYERKLGMYFDNGEGKTSTAAVTAWNSGAAFQVAPAGTIRRIVRFLFGAGDLFADQPEFAARFRLTGPSDAVATRLLSKAARTWLLDNPGWTLESDGSNLVLYRDRLLSRVAHFPDQAAKLLEILRLLMLQPLESREPTSDFPPIWVSGA